MDDLIRRYAAIEVVGAIWAFTGDVNVAKAWDQINALPPAQPEIIRCRDCKFYTPLNRETNSGICGLLLHQNFGDDWYCAGAERRTKERGEDD